MKHYIFSILVFLIFGKVENFANQHIPACIIKLNSAVPIIDDNIQYFEPYLTESYNKFESGIYNEILDTTSFIRIIKFNKSKYENFNNDSSNYSKKIPIEVSWIVFKNKDSVCYFQYLTWDGNPNEKTFFKKSQLIKGINYKNYISNLNKSQYYYPTQGSSFDELYLISIKSGSELISIWVSGLEIIPELFNSKNIGDPQLGFNIREYLQSFYEGEYDKYDSYNQYITQIAFLWKYFICVNNSLCGTDANNYLNEISRGY